MVKFRYEEFEITLSRDSHPYEVMLEVTRRCNLTCIYCFRDNLPNDYFIDMDKKVYNEFISQANKIGISKIAFTGWGEPLIHPNIIEFIELAKKSGIKVLLNTNGYFLRDHARDLVEIGVDEIVISIDAGDEDIYKNIRRGGELKRLIDGIEAINIYRKNKGSPILRFQYTLNKLNINNIINVAKLAKDLKVKDIIISNMIPNNITTSKLLQCINDRECIEKLNNIRVKLVKITLDTNIGFQISETRIKTDRRCPFMEKNAFYLTAEGDVSPCIYYAHSWKPIINGILREIKPVRFGNILKENILKIWRKKEYVRFRFNTRFAYMPSCLDCELEEVCSITRTNEYDCWGNAPTCSHCPYARNLVSCPL